MASTLLKRWAILRAVLSMLAVGVLLSSCTPQDARLAGIDMKGEPATDFRLTGHAGDTVQLSSLRGRVVVLTFLYTSCPDTCPLIAGKFGVVHDRLGQLAQGSSFLAVTVDPERDTPYRLRQYLEAQQLQGKMDFLTGSRPDLEKIWTAYHVGVQRPPARAEVGGSGQGYEVAHTEAVYVIDKQGKLRRLFKADFEPAALAKDVELLSRE
ncbi:MAG TPA: SCO family protein [Chloroflexota bacterium]|nr:SCO family protein [Chloroflexota bacterium]